MQADITIADVFRSAVAYAPGVNAVVLPERARLEAVVVSINCDKCRNEVVIELAQIHQGVWAGYCGACSSVHAISSLDLRKLCRLTLGSMASDCSSSQGSSKSARSRDGDGSDHGGVRGWFIALGLCVSEWLSSSKTHRVSRRQRRQFRIAAAVVCSLLLLPVLIWLGLWAMHNSPPALPGFLRR